MVPFRQVKKVLSEDEFRLYERSFWKDLPPARVKEDLKLARRYQQKYFSKTNKNREDPRYLVFREISQRLEEMSGTESAEDVGAIGLS